MKLAQALKEKSRLKKEIADLREKLELSARAEQKTGESPKKLLLNLEESLRRMEHLVAAIYHTNDVITVDGKTMTQWIYTRDTLFFRLELYKKLIRLSADSENPTEMNLTELEIKAERMKEEIRTLSDMIQKTNWERELIE